MDKKELVILSQFRRNARENLTTASRNIRIPISTIYDRLKKYEGSVIRKHTSILDFTQLGYGIKIHMVIKVAPPQRKRLCEFLTRHPRVNSLFSISNGYDFLVEVILKSIQEVSNFGKLLDKFQILDRHEFYIVEDIKREAFLSDPELTDISTHVVTTKT